MPFTSTYRRWTMWYILCRQMRTPVPQYLKHDAPHLCTCVTRFTSRASVANLRPQSTASRAAAPPPSPHARTSTDPPPWASAWYASLRLYVGICDRTPPVSGRKWYGIDAFSSVSFPSPSSGRTDRYGLTVSYRSPSAVPSCRLWRCCCSVNGSRGSRHSPGGAPAGGARSSSPSLSGPRSARPTPRNGATSSTLSNWIELTFSRTLCTQSCTSVSTSSESCARRIARRTRRSDAPTSHTTMWKCREPRPCPSSGPWYARTSPNTPPTPFDATPSAALHPCRDVPTTVSMKHSSIVR